MKRLSFNEFWEVRDNYRLIDVREEHEYNEAHVQDAELFPLSKIQNGHSPKFDAREVALICRSGGRSQTAAMIFEEQGEECTNIEGGTMAAIVNCKNCIISEIE